MKERSVTNVLVKVQGGGPEAAPPLLGSAAARIPTGGKIRAGIKVLTRKAADDPQACAIYERGVNEGRSFDQIEQAILEAVPKLKSPLVPRNVPWFTVREHDFANPELARQIMDMHAEDRGEGKRLYRFPVVFPSDHWPTVMPHELAAWGASDKRYWSQYSPDGRVRQCVCHAPVPVDETGRRTIRLFGGRKVIPREANAGLCEPEVCPEYQRRECNLTGRFVFYIPGIRSVSAFELHTNSFYAMNAAIQKFQAVAFMRGGRIAGFLDRQQTPFYLSKRLMEVRRVDERGQMVRTPQWIIDLEAPVDVAALLREHEDAETALQDARFAARVLQGGQAALDATQVDGRHGASRVGEADPDAERPSVAQLLARAQEYGVEREQFLGYADARWGAGWRLNPHGRARAWDDIERHRNDPQGFRDKVASAANGHGVEQQS
jgi:Recombination directionality factor-like